MICQPLLPKTQLRSFISLDPRRRATQRAGRNALVYSFQGSYSLGLQLFELVMTAIVRYGSPTCAPFIIV